MSELNKSENSSPFFDFFGFFSILLSFKDLVGPAFSTGETILRFFPFAVSFPSGLRVDGGFAPNWS